MQNQNKFGSLIKISTEEREILLNDAIERVTSFEVVWKEI
jgi:hypothetical protein